MAQNPIVTFETTQGTIEAELYPEIAPNTVNNFLSLIGKGFYDGLIFHRVIKGFMIQGGCPDGTGMGGPGYSIKGEFKQNGFANDLKHEPGVLSMARTMMPNSAGSQFFIMHKNSPHLDGSYAAFGKIVDGLDIVNKIADVPTDYMDRPLEDQEDNARKKAFRSGIASNASTARRSISLKSDALDISILTAFEISL